jgi:hypothetical protein
MPQSKGKSDLLMRRNNKGLTVKINLFPVEKGCNAKIARLWMVGQVTDADTGKVIKFNDGGGLISILGKLNAKKAKDKK